MIKSDWKDDEENNDNIHSNLKLGIQNVKNDCDGVRAVKSSTTAIF